MTISNAMSICHKNGVKVYPIKEKVCVDRENTEPIIYSKTPSNLNEALAATYIHEAKKIISSSNPSSLLNP